MCGWGGREGLQMVEEEGLRDTAGGVKDGRGVGGGGGAIHYLEEHLYGR